MDGKALDKFSTARHWMLLDNPSLTVFALNLPLKEDKDCPTAYTDGKIIGYNPEYVLGLSFEHLQTLAIHEIAHCFLMHPARYSEILKINPDINHKKFNVAADYAINILLHDAKMKIITGGLIDEKFRGMDVMQIYRLLPNDTKNEKNQSEIRPSDNPDDAKTKMQETIATAKHQAKLSGNNGGAFESIFDHVFDQKVNWKDRLREYAKLATKDDTSWRKLNRRFLSQDVYLPGTFSEKLGEIVLVIDTSGSMNTETLSEIISELNMLISETKPVSVRVIGCNYDIVFDKTFETEDGEPLDLTGLKAGGGTSFIPPFMAIDYSPACLIYFTDLACWNYPDPPDYPVLWLAYNSGDTTTPFGEVVRIS